MSYEYGFRAARPRWDIPGWTASQNRHAGGVSSGKRPAVQPPTFPAGGAARPCSPARLTGANWRGAHPPMGAGSPRRCRHGARLLV